MIRWAVVCCMAVAGCTAAPPAPRLPPDPPEAVNTPYFDPPSDIRSVHARAAGRVWSELSARFDGLERHARLLRPGTDRQAVVAHYRRALPGWTTIAIAAQPAPGWAFGLARGDCVLAVLALDAGPQARQPAAIISNLKRSDVQSREPQDEKRPKSCG